MPTPAEYRSQADEYVERANAVISPARRLRLLSMAEDCLRLAEQAQAPDARPAEETRRVTPAGSVRSL